MSLKKTYEGQGTGKKKSGESQEIFCVKFIFSQFEDPNFEIFWASMPPDGPYGLGLIVSKSQGKVR